MPTLTVQTVRIDSVTFVEAVLKTEQPCRVRLETRFDDAVWPPRANGGILEGWDADGVTIETGVGTTAIGFATPAVAGDRPIEIVRSEPYETVQSKVKAWIERIETRAESAESLAAVDDVPAAADAVAAAGGLREIETLAGEIARDRRVATQLSIIPDELCKRLRRVEIPIETFATLADGHS